MPQPGGCVHCEADACQRSAFVVVVPCQRLRRHSEKVETLERPHAKRRPPDAAASPAPGGGRDAAPGNAHEAALSETSRKIDVLEQARFAVAADRYEIFATYEDGLVTSGAAEQTR